MSRFLTVREAAALTGKSASSIRRILYPIIQKPGHPERNQIQPVEDEVVKLRLKGENFAWRLSEELLRREVPEDKSVERGSEEPSPRPVSDGNASLLDMLQKELEIKNKQITQQSDLISKQMELISGLSERLREGNILIGSLQKHLTLPEPKKTVDAQPVENARPAPAAQGKGTKAPSKASKPKRGFFGSLFW